MEFTRYQLDNGLKLLVHQDSSTPLVSVCMTYNVGTKDEQKDKTGYAHLFEHLMFGGSENATSFDDYIQQAGGENNAFTNQDMTVYYEYLPCQNLELALWLEADRMAALKLTPKTLERERKVVLEEFKESCLNEPYGDIWHWIGPLVYRQHPYSVPTIGKIPQHIEEATLEDVQAFFERYYCPSNAVLSVCGNVEPQDVWALTQKWFGDLPTGNPQKIIAPVEPPQQERRVLEVEAEVPLDALYMVFRSAARKDSAYYVDDLITDVLSEGDAAWLYQHLVKEQECFSTVEAYITSSLEDGLLIIEGKLAEGVSFEEAEKAIWKELQQLTKEPLSKQAVEKFKHCTEHNLEFSELNNLHKAINLGYYEVLGDANWINLEKEKYNSVTAAAIQERSKTLFQSENCSVIYYKSKEQSNE
ncbi:MAG: M16 family metallopeptidase [Aureispira sp.]